MKIISSIKTSPYILEDELNLNEKPEYRKALTPLVVLPLFSQDHKLKGFKNLN